VIAGDRPAQRGPATNCIAPEPPPMGSRLNQTLDSWSPATGQWGASASERLKRRTPAGRWGRPEELGALAVYVAGVGSTWHTGDELVIDGGFRIA
jgi:NAD(P)-dependent dehydrogenase (short-subunit alcohol dehydrogenase family)